MIHRTVLISTMALLVPLISSASPVPRFTDFLETQVSSAEKAMSTEGADDRGPGFEIDQFYLKIAPSMAFDIPELTEIQVSPEIGLMWESR